MYQPPDEITIPPPLPTARGRGLNATGDLYGRNVKVRISYNERELLEEVCSALDITRAAFIRWCSVRVAEVIKEDMQRNS